MKIIEPKIIKTDTCKSSSGQSTLTYNIGKVGSDTQFQIEANTGTGFFSKEWISLKDIQEAITKDKPFTSTVLYPLFQGKSINTPAFMLAVLLNEGLVKRSKRCYESLDPSAFMKSVKAEKPDTKRKPASTAYTADHEHPYCSIVNTSLVHALGFVILPLSVHDQSNLTVFFA